MNIFQSAFLGIVQGLTEFLPISSSGHLVLFQKIFGLTGNTLSFDVFVHLGTLLAVIIVFRKDILSILKDPFGKLAVLLVIGTIPAVIVGIVFKDIIEAVFASGATIGVEFIITGFILVWAEKISRCHSEGDKTDRHSERPVSLRLSRSGSEESDHLLIPSVIPSKDGIQSPTSSACSPKTLPSMTVVDAIVIGIAQAVAILPAISRSGLTIAGALSRKLDREFALKYSFLLSIPAILGSAVFDGVNIIKDPGSIQLIPILIGTIAAAISGYFAIRYMLKVFSKKSLMPFAVYVFILGGLIIIDQAITHIFF